MSDSTRIITLRVRSRYDISFVRVRSSTCLISIYDSIVFRDGLERVKIAPSATVGDLKQVIADNLLGGSLEFALSQNPELLTTRDDVGFCPGTFPYLLSSLFQYVVVLTSRCHQLLQSLSQIWQIILLR